MGVADSSPGSAPLIRRLLIALTGVFALGLSVLYVLPFITPSAVDRSIIEGFLGRATGRPVQVTGDASYSLFPRFRVSAKNIVIPSYSAGEAPEFTDIGALDFSLDSIALLFNEIKVLSLKIAEPTVRFHRDEQGRVNWLAHKEQERSVDQPFYWLPDHDWGWWNDLEFGEFKISGARLLYVDRQSGRRITGQDGNFRIEPVASSESAPGLRFIGSLNVNGEPVEVSLESGPLTRFLSGARTPIFAEISAAPARVRYRGSAAKRQYLVSEGELDVEAPELRGLEAWLGPVFPSPVDGGLKATAALIANGNRVSVENVRIDIGDSEATGRLDVAIAPSGARADGHVNISSLNLAAMPAKGLSDLWPVWLGGQIEVKWAELTFDGLELGDGEVVVRSSRGRSDLSVSASRLSLYGGEARGTFTIERSEGMASLDLRANLANVEVGAVLRRMWYQPIIEGRTNLDLRVFSVGSTPAELVAAMRGEGRFNVNRGILHDIGFVGYLTDHVEDSLPFDQLVGSISIESGVLSGDDFLLSGEPLSLVGATRIDLADGSVDANVQTLKTSKRKEGRTIKPFRIAGTVTDMEVYLEQIRFNRGHILLRQSS